MAEPTVFPLRLVATTLPGMAGAPLSEDVSIPGLARRAGELAKQNGCDVVVGFSHGATVALDMVLSGHFHKSIHRSKSSQPRGPPVGSSIGG